MNDKIRREHLQRTAYIYVRQSTPQQVRNHLEQRTAVRARRPSAPARIFECHHH